jgi:hypothetical protein
VPIPEFIAVRAFGQGVAGTTRCCRNTISVEITAPFAGVRRYLYVSNYSKALGPIEDDAGHLTARGFSIAKRLLCQLHDDCHFCEAHEAELVAECRRFRERDHWLLWKEAVANYDFAADWWLLPVFLCFCLFTDWLVIDRCGSALRSAFGRLLPEDIVRQLLVVAGSYPKTRL